MDISIIYNGTTLTFDLAIRNGDIATDNGLLAAVLVSLFTDRRANADDVLPDDAQGRASAAGAGRPGAAGTGDRRGWWADAWPEIDGDLIGSRLWLLSREKQLPDVLQRAQVYAEEALAWLAEDGIAKYVSAPAEWVRAGVLGLLIDIRLKDGTGFEAVINYPLEG